VGVLLLLALVVGAPFPYGAVLAPAVLRLELLAFAAAFATAFSRPTRALGAAIGPVAALGALALLGAFQLVPLKPGVVRSLSPMSAEIYHETSRVLAAAGRLTAPNPRISIAPTETESTLLLALAYLALFVSAALLLQSRAKRRIFAGVVLAAAVAEIVVGILTTDIAAERLHGAFVNPDHFAGYLEIALALAFGAIWAEVLTGADRGRGLTDRATRFERRLIPFGSYILLWGFLAGGIVLTRSRGGILAAALSTVALLALGLWHRRRRRLPVAVLSGLAILLGVSLIAGATKREALLRFLASDPRDMDADLRVSIWKTSLRTASDYPLFGSGLGTFREAFRRVQPRGLEGLVEQAHCDALQLLVTGGWIGFAMGLVLTVSLSTVLIRALGRQRHREESAFVLAGIGALLSLVLHGLVDFNFSIPAIPATLACVVGAAWAAGRDDRIGGRTPERD
jgi:O-antigen ligase